MQCQALDRRAQEAALSEGQGLLVALHAGWEERGCGGAQASIQRQRAPHGRERFPLPFAPPPARQLPACTLAAALLGFTYASDDFSYADLETQRFGCFFLLRT